MTLTSGGFIVLEGVGVGQSEHMLQFLHYRI